MWHDVNWTDIPMDWEPAQIGLGESIDAETMIIALLAVLGFACLRPLLAMGGQSQADEEDGRHPLRSKLHSRNRDWSARRSDPKSASARRSKR